MLTIALEEIYARQDEGPAPALSDALRRQLALLDDNKHLAGHQICSSANGAGVDTGELFEAAWTTFSPAAYDHRLR
jgi:hypothetical protein